MATMYQAYYVQPCMKCAKLTQVTFDAGAGRGECAFCCIGRLEDELDRLRAFETKYNELAKALVSTEAKLARIEAVIDEEIAAEDWAEEQTEHPVCRVAGIAPFGLRWHVAGRVRRHRTYRIALIEAYHIHLTDEEAVAND